MSRMNPKIKKVSEYGEPGRFCPRKVKSRKFISKKKQVGRCKDIKNDVFDLVPQGQTNLFAN